MKKITREQKKIYAVFAVVLLSLLGFIVFIFMPESRKLKAIKAKLHDTEAKITEITNIAKGKDLVEVVQNLNEQLKEIEDRLPQKPEDIIDDLSNYAKKLGIESKSINFSQKKPIERKVPGYEIMELPIDMKLVCDYRALGEYIKTLHSNDFPAVMKIEQMEIRGKGEGNTNLEVALRLIVYLKK